MSDPLTVRQKEVYDWLLEWARLNGAGPTVREIAAEFDMSINGAMSHLRMLMNKGWIQGVTGDGEAIRYFRPTCSYVVEAIT